MQATVDQQGCIGCGLCTGICSEVFALNDEGKAEAIVDPVPPEAEAAAQEARDSCPVSVIDIQE